MSAIAVRQEGQSALTFYYVHPDHLGSISVVTDRDGAVKQKCTYDAWGRRTLVSGSLIFDRGFTGHEHLDEFALINMNGRMYDPVIGRFLSPDPYVQSPLYAQSFNRYSYAWNNPLIYTDPDGEWIHILIGGIVGGAVNLVTKAFQGKIHSFKDGLVAFGIGAAAGALGAATGGTAFLAAGGGAAGAGGFLAGAASGMIGSAFSMPLLSIDNSAYFGDPMMTGKEYLTGVLGGALIGGSVSGITALANGRTFWSGTVKPVVPTPPTNTAPLQLKPAPKTELNTESLRGQIKSEVVEWNYTHETPDFRLEVKMDVLSNKLDYTYVEKARLNPRFLTTPEGTTVDLKPTLDRISIGGKFPHVRDGSVFRNAEGLLPKQNIGYYTEFVNPTPGITGPGAMRIVVGKNGEMWFTLDHYKTFIPIKY